MAEKISVTNKVVDGSTEALMDLQEAVLEDPTGVYGIREKDSGTVLVASGTSITRISEGLYEYDLTLVGLYSVYTAYEYCVKVTKLGGAVEYILGDIAALYVTESGVTPSSYLEVLQLNNSLFRLTPQEREWKFKLRTFHVGDDGPPFDFLIERDDEVLDPSSATGIIVNARLNRATAIKFQRSLVSGVSVVTDDDSNKRVRVEFASGNLNEPGIYQLQMILTWPDYTETSPIPFEFRVLPIWGA